MSVTSRIASSLFVWSLMSTMVVMSTEDPSTPEIKNNKKKNEANWCEVTEKNVI